MFSLLKSFSGAEGLGELFEFQVEALSEQENIDFDQALGQSCTIKLKTYNDKERFFCGILTHAQWVGAEVGGEQDYSHYRVGAATVVLAAGSPRRLPNFSG